MKKIDVQDRLDDGAVRFTAILEVVGKPQAHIEKTAKDIMKQIENDQMFDIISSDAHDSVEIEGTESLFTLFIEFDVLSDKYSRVYDFCFKYMPASIEVSDPETLKISASDSSGLVNDFVSKLHQVDGIIKQKNQELAITQKSLNVMIYNSIIIFLNFGPKIVSQIAKGIGLPENKVQEFLDRLVQDEKIQKDGEKYSIIKQ